MLFTFISVSFQISGVHSAQCSVPLLFRIGITARLCK